MRRRSRAGGKSAKARSRKTVAPRAANTPKTGSRRSATADHKTKIALLERQLSESLEQQAATSEVLQIISSPQTSITAVLDAVAANAVRLCEALNATIYLRDGDAVEIHAQSGPLRGGQIGTRRALNNDWVAGRAVLEARTIHVPDLFTSDEYPRSREIALRYGHRATLAIRRLRPILAHWASVDALRARVCVQAIASDNGTKRASSRAGASQCGPTARSFTIHARLIPPAYVRPYVKRQKNDMADAEAICKAVTRANIRTGQGGN